jgi:hypothetical protein
VEQRPERDRLEVGPADPQAPREPLGQVGEPVAVAADGAVAGLEHAREHAAEHRGYEALADVLLAALCPLEDGRDGGLELRHRERLGDQARRAARQGLAQVRVRAGTGDEQDGQARPSLPHRLGQLEAVEPGHDDVGDHEAHAVVLEAHERDVVRRGLDGLVPATGEHLDHGRPDDRIVVDDEDPPEWSSNACPSRRCRHRRSYRPALRGIDLPCRR